MNKANKASVALQVRLFIRDPKIRASWLDSLPNYGKRPPTYRLDNAIWWILKLGGYIQD